MQILFPTTKTTPNTVQSSVQRKLNLIFILKSNNIALVVSINPSKVIFQAPKSRVCLKAPRHRRSKCHCNKWVFRSDLYMLSCVVFGSILLKRLCQQKRLGVYKFFAQQSTVNRSDWSKLYICIHIDRRGCLP